MKYSIILFDADNTVLDFDAAEQQALKMALEFNDLTYSEDVLKVYRKINVNEWQRYERGEISREEVLLNRFVITAKEVAIPDVTLNHIRKISDDYEKYLHFGYDIIPHAEEVLDKLKSNGYRLYIVSNGVLSIQNSRMQGSGLEKYFEKRFVSEVIGFPKPNSEFFKRVFAQISDFHIVETLIVGDSLSGDIQGGVNVGIDTCWFNPHGVSNSAGIKPTYEITDLRELLKIV